MQTFVYKARNDEGALFEGNMQADRREAVVSMLKQKGYFLVSVESQSRLWSLLHTQRESGLRIGLRDKAVFTHQLATLLKAGMQLSSALKTLAVQTENKKLGAIIQQLNQDVEQSSSLSQAMAKYPKVFSKVYVAIVQSAEQTGSLGDTLAVLSQQLKTQASVRARIRGAMVYPMFLLVVSGIIVGVLSVYIIPKFLKLFVNAQQDLPLSTQILIQTTNIVGRFWWLIGIGLIALAGILLAVLREPRFRLSVYALLLRLPVIGSLNRKLQLAGFARTLGSLLCGGVQIVPAVHTTQGTSSNPAFAKTVGEVEEDILKGCSLAEAVGKQPYFNDLVTNMIAVGEKTGRLSEMLLDIAEMYDQDCESAMSSLTSVLGPALIVVLGGLIGFIVMAVLLPIFQTTTLIV